MLNEPHVAPPTQVSGSPSTLREAVVQTINTDGTLDLKALDSRAGWRNVAAPAWYVPVIGDHVIVADLQGDTQKAVIVTPLASNSGADVDSGSVGGHSFTTTAEQPTAGAGFTVANAAVLTTPDRVSGVVIPSGGAFVSVSFMARAQVTSSNGTSGVAGGLALFVGGTQLSEQGGASAAVLNRVDISKSTLAIGVVGSGFLRDLNTGPITLSAGSLVAAPASGTPLRTTPMVLWINAGTYTFEVRYWSDTNFASALTFQDRRFAVAVLP